LEFVVRTSQSKTRLENPAMSVNHGIHAEVESLRSHKVKEVGPSFSKENRLTDLVGVTFPVSLFEITPNYPHA